MTQRDTTKLPERNDDSTLSFNNNSNSTSSSSSIIIVSLLHRSHHRTGSNRSNKKDDKGPKTVHRTKDHTTTNDNINDDEESDHQHHHDTDLMSYLFSQDNNINSNNSNHTVPIDSASNITSISEIDSTSQQQIASPSAAMNAFPMGLIIDYDNNNNNNTSNDYNNSSNHHQQHQHQQLIDTINHIRLSLPLDSKRPTVNRRFYHDTNLQIVQHLERIVYDALTSTISSSSSTSSTTTSIPMHHDNNHDTNNNIDNTNQMKKEKKKLKYFIYCNRYLRILEYNTIGIGLPPHTDGIKICDTTYHHSTHTLLFYLSNCTSGGETVIMINPNSNSKNNNNKINKINKQQQQQRSVVVPTDRIYQLPILLNTDQLVEIDTNTKDNGSEEQQRQSSTTYYHQYIDVSQGCIETNVCLGISPKIGRILLFPHTWTHAGAICNSIPKIMLRAEMTIQYSFDEI